MPGPRSIRSSHATHSLEGGHFSTRVQHRLSVTFSRVVLPVVHQHLASFCEVFFVSTAEIFVSRRWIFHISIACTTSIPAAAARAAERSPAVALVGEVAAISVSIFSSEGVQSALVDVEGAHLFRFFLTETLRLAVAGGRRLGLGLLLLLLFYLGSESAEVDVGLRTGIITIFV